MSTDASRQKQLRIVLAVAVVSLILVSLFGLPRSTPKDKRTPAKRTTSGLFSVTHGGHRYIEVIHYEGGVSLVHDPDCTCVSKLSSLHTEYHNGHSYIKSTDRRGVALVHDPDCTCTRRSYR